MALLERIAQAQIAGTSFRTTSQATKLSPSDLVLQVIATDSGGTEYASTATPYAPHGDRAVTLWKQLVEQVLQQLPQTAAG